MQDIMEVNQMLAQLEQREVESQPESFDSNELRDIIERHFNNLISELQDRVNQNDGCVAATFFDEDLKEGYLDSTETLMRGYLEFERGCAAIDWREVG
tara:strand:+ start:2350 stop:2643 length:294 start_codon:yes stop_codon:yes gene_type:complete